MRVIIIILIAIAVSLISCSTYSHYEESKPDKVMETEARLAQAGFKRVSIETPDQNGAVAQLALYQINRYDSAKGSVFWYADPTICQCLYQGDLAAYQRYEGTLEQDKDIADYMNDTQPDQVANLGYFGETFPPPSMFGPVWPPFFVVPGPGSPVHSVGGHGGSPIHMHHPGGGRSIGHGSGHGHR